MNNDERLFGYQLERIYDLYLTKVERKGRTRAELDSVLAWLLGINVYDLAPLVGSNITLRQLFERIELTPNAHLITGVICGIRVEEIQDPLVQKIRYMDKVVDELARGKALAKILR